MKRIISLLSLAAACLATGPQARVLTFHHENVLGTSCDLKILAHSAEGAQIAETAALAEIDRLAKILSGYDPESEFSRWSRTSNVAVPVSPELAEVLALWDHWTAETNGALNPAAETAARLWREAQRTGAPPFAPTLAEATARMRGPHWALEGQIATRVGNAPLMLNSFTKSWILDRAANAAIQTGGVEGLMLNIGGDLVTRGELVETVRVANPLDDAENATPIATLTAANLAVATSGNYRRGFTIGGRSYSHIIDPRTALPVDHIRSATVVSPDAVEAGALATAFDVLSPAESARLAARHPRVEYLLVASSGERFASPGWPGLLLAAQSPSPSTTEVNVQFELARIDAGRYRRPFVALWIEDKDKFPVRTVALWYDRPRWLPDLKGWSRADRVRSLAEGTDIAGTIASATRPPGKYTVKWDGKDQAGKLVKPGKYTVYLEAAREHGTYQLLHQEIDLTESKLFTLEGGTEIASASVEVKKSK